MKDLLVLFCIVFCSAALSAQTTDQAARAHQSSAANSGDRQLLTEVTVGNGTDTASYPFHTYYMDAKTQLLYHASDIIAAGGGAGVISAIAFNVKRKDTLTMHEFHIDMQNTDSTAMHAFVNSGWSTAYSGSYSVTGTGWQMIPLQTPFAWDGTSNLMINICFDNVLFAYFSSVYATINIYKVWFERLDAAVGCSLNAGNTLTRLPNIRLYFGGLPDQFDAGIIKILTPDTVATAFDSAEVKIRIKNFGSAVLTSIPVNYDISGTVANETWTGTLNPGDSADYTFAEKFLCPVLSHILCAYTTLPADTNNANDEVCMNVFGISGMDQYGSEDLYVYQNIPNPSDEKTSIQYRVPASGSIIFEIRDKLGRLVYSEDKHCDKGRGIIDVETKSLAAGEYYYSVQYNGQRLVRKMMVAR